MTDRELLEKAARAAGYTLEDNGLDVNGVQWYWCPELGDYWDALQDDGDAFRLIAKLRFHVDATPPGWLVESNDSGVHAGENYGPDPAESLRRAVVRAAAASVGGE